MVVMGYVIFNSALDPDQTYLSLLSCNLIVGSPALCLEQRATKFHAWPYRWYEEKTIVDPSNWLYGFPIAIEYRGGSLPDHQTTLHRGDECLLNTSSSLCTNSTLPTFAEVQLVLAPNPWNALNGVVVTQSNTGTVSVVNTAQGIGLSLATGSPVWVGLASNVPQAFNTIEFNYKFNSRAEGLLSVFIDDQVVFKADELQAQTGINASGRIAVANVTPGQHTLSFRLDHFSTAPSSVEISNITVATASVIRVANQKPISSAGANQLVRLGSLVKLDGSSSVDPDQKPLPLTFHWVQTSGPATLLFDSTTAAPSFVPSTKGTYVFSLLVNDGQANSDAASVAVVVPGLGDIDGDGDVDANDLARINAALNTQASGPNDLRDLDGDGRITGLDARKLVTLCTRPRCANQ